MTLFHRFTASLCRILASSVPPRLLAKADCCMTLGKNSSLSNEMCLSYFPRCISSASLDRQKNALDRLDRMPLHSSSMHVTNTRLPKKQNTTPFLLCRLNDVKGVLIIERQHTHASDSATCTNAHGRHPFLEAASETSNGFEMLCMLR